MKFYTLLISLLLFMGNALSAEDWHSVSNPYPVRSAISHGDGALLATDGGVRFRSMNRDVVFHSENGLETSAFYALAESPRGVYAVSEFGLIAALNPDGNSWRVLNRSLLSNNVHARPDGAIVAGSNLVVAFDDRLVFFDLNASSSILSIERIANQSLSVNPIDKMVVKGDSLFVRMGEKAFVRSMKWDNLRGDVQLSNPASWTQVKDFSKVSGLGPVDLKQVKVDGDTLGLDALFNIYGNSRVKWILKTTDGYILSGADFIFHYNGDSKNKTYADLSAYSSFSLEDIYEIRALPVGGVVAASLYGAISHGDGSTWTYPENPYAENIGSFTSAYNGRMKTLAVLPDGHVFYHIWGMGYFIYTKWGDAIEGKVLPTDAHCIESYVGSSYTVSIAAAPAPDGSGFLTVAGNKKGYSIIYFTTDGEIHYAQQAGSTPFAGPIYATLAEDGSWILYVGSRDGNMAVGEGDLDVFKFPAPRTNGGELANGSVRTYRGLSSALIDMAYDKVSGKLWVASMSGLAYFDQDRDTLMTPQSMKGLRGGDFTSLDVDIHGNLWLGTVGQGAYRLTPRENTCDTLTVTAFGSRHGMLSNDVMDLAVDPVFGAVWFAHSNGVSRYLRNDLKDASQNMTDSASADVKAYPIPFRPKVFPRFTIDNISEDAVVSIFNRGGALIRSFSGSETLGGKVEWDGNGKNGRLVAPGVYYYVVRNSSKTVKGKFIIIH